MATPPYPSIHSRPSSPRRRNTGTKKEDDRGKKAGQIYHADRHRIKGSYSFEGYTYTSGGKHKVRRSSRYADKEEEGDKDLLADLDDDYAEGNLLIANFIVVIVSVDLILAAILYVNATTRGTELYQNTTLSHQTSRKATQILTDNLDCSLLMKDAALKKLPVEQQMWRGLVCLERINSVALPQSRQRYVSTMLSYSQGREGLALSCSNGYITECSGIAKDSLRDFYKVTRGHVSQGLSSDLSYGSELYDVWLGEGPERTAHFSNDTELYDVWMGETMKESEANRVFCLKNPKLATRIFPLYFSSYNDTVTKPDLVVNSSLSGTLGEEPWRTNVTIDGYSTRTLQLLPETNTGRYELHFPYNNKALSSSVISAFIIRVVYQIMLTEKLERGYADANLHGLLLRAHLYAENQDLFLGKNDTNSSEEEKPDFLSEKHINSLSHATMTARNLPEMKNRSVFDRVMTSILWSSNIRETVLMTNIGSVLKSDHNDGNMTMHEIRSAAGLMVMDKNHDNRTFIVASASGSLRTIEAVAFPVLRILLFGEQPGAAIHADASFYDYETGKFVCENQDPEFLRVLKETYGIQDCHRPEHNKATHIDRTAMIAKRKLPRGPTAAAIDSRSPDFNYPVGF